MSARLLVRLLAFEGIILTVFGVAYAVVGLVGDSASTSGPASGGAAPAEFAAAAVVAAGVVLLLLARATSRGRAWSRSPAIVLNVFPFPIALGVLQAGVWWVAVPMVLLAGTVLYLYTTPQVRTALHDPS